MAATKKTKMPQKSALLKASKKIVEQKNSGPKPVFQAYDEIAEDWDCKRQNPSSVMPLFLDNLNRFFKGTFFGARILDAGCGNGRNAAYLIKNLKYASLSCCDLSLGMLMQAKKTVMANNYGHSIELRLGNVSSLPFQTKSFSAVICLAVLHHLNTQNKRLAAFKEIFRVLRVPGIALISVWSSTHTKLAKFKGKKEAMVDWKSDNGKTTSRYYYFFEKAELEKYAKAAGFNVAEIFFEKNGKKQKTQEGSSNICLVLAKR